MSERVYYAIGDVHGEAARLERLHGQILDDIARSGAPARIIHLGDLIDRGPRSRDCVIAAMALHARKDPNIEVISLRGNHEQMLLDAYDDLRDRNTNHWLNNGGDVALASYEVCNGIFDDWRGALDADHVAFLRSMPTMAFDEKRRLVFVHAGIDPARFPDCDDHLRQWTRSRRFFDTRQWPDRKALEGLLVVHGHTPTRTFTPYVDDRRINVDTGAVYGGVLTAVVLAKGQEPRFLSA